MKRTSLYVVACIIFFAQSSFAQNHIEKLTKWFSGEYSTNEQAAVDSQTIALHLEVTPFILNNQIGEWFYLETAFNSSPNSPYRQEVYQFHPSNFGFINLDIYEISDKDSYVGAMKNNSLLEKLTIEDLVLKKGCSIYLKKIDDAFIGTTPGEKCISTLRKANYSKTDFEITEVDFFLWERGFDLRDKQVWGQKDNGYIFKRTPKTKE